MAKLTRKKTIRRVKSASCGKIHHKKRKGARKSKKSLLDRIFSW